jgi:hypothetical protein
VTACGETAAGGDGRLKLANASLESGRLRSWALEVVSNFAVDVGSGTGEAGRLDGLKNDGVLMAYITQVLDECMLEGFMVVGVVEC